MRPVAAALLILLIGLVGTASAARNLNWFNWSNNDPGSGGLPPTTRTVVAGQTFPIWVTVDSSGPGNDNWECTRFAFTGPGNVTRDVSSPNYNSGTNTHQHAVTAPTTAGTYSLTVTAFQYNDCTSNSGANGTLTKTSAVKVIVPVPGGRPPVMQTYFVSEPEDHQWTAYNAIKNSTLVPPSNNIRTHIGVTIGFEGTVLYYDQWENGFDADITHPTNIWSTSNPGGTQIWGDADPTNGAPPGFPQDYFLPGDVVILQNMVPGNPRGNDIYYDGRDKIGASQPIAVTRLGWAEPTPGSLLAYANAMFPVAEWGSLYTVPTGCNTTTSANNFEYSALAIIAAFNGTKVEIDADGNGTYETSVTLQQGEHYLAASSPTGSACPYIMQGAHVRSTDPTKPIQVQLLTGDIGSTYAGRDLNLVPDADLGYDYLVPVGVANGGGTRLFLFNPEISSLYVRCEVGTGPTVTNLTIPPSGLNATITLPSDAAAHCYAVTTAGGTTPDSSRHFTGMAVVDDGSSSWDWAVPLMPSNILSNMAIVGIGFGRDPFSSTSTSQNGSPLWVTPHCTPHGSGSTWFYVDWNNDGVPDLVDFNGDGDADDTWVNGLNETTSQNGFQVANGKSVRLFRPGLPPDQTGAYIYTKTGQNNPANDPGGCVFAAAWGEDPRTASSGAPGMDLGTIVIPLRGEQIAKTSTLVHDNDGDGKPGPGDTLRFTISITNVGFAPIAVSVYDTIPQYTTYVANSTYKFTPGPGGVQIADLGGPGNAAFPLAVNSPIGVSLGSLPSNATWKVEFDVILDTPGTGDDNYDEITNCAMVGINGTPNETCDIEEIVPPLVLELTKTADPMNPGVNQNVTYTIKYWNVKQEPYTDLATHLTVTDPLSTDLIFISATPTGAGSCAHDGSAYGGLITCSGLDNLGPATPPDAPFGTITVVAKVRNTPATQAPGHQIPNTATVCGVGATRPDDPAYYVCDDDTVIITTPVTVDYFSATETAGGVRFDWSTATETANAGFNLYALTPDGGVVKLNDDLILSTVIDSTEPVDYSVELAGVPAGRYFIEDVSLTGETRAHEAIDLNGSSGARVAPDLIDWAAINAGNAALEQARAAATTAGGFSTDRLNDRSFIRATAPAALDLRVRADGIYRLTYEQIKAAGVDLAGVSRSSLALTNRGEPVPIYVSQARFGKGAWIEFVGHGLDTLYTDANVYRLEVDRSLSRQMTISRSAPPRGNAFPAYYMETVRIENNKAYSYLSPNGDPWYDYFLMATPGKPASRSTTVALSDPVAQDAAGNPLSATVTYDIWGASEMFAGDDHHAQLTADGQLIADQLFDGNEAFALSGQLTNFGDKVDLTLKAPGDHSNVGGIANFVDVFAVEAYSVTYPRSFRAVDGQLEFTARARGYQVSNLDSGQIVVYRVDGGQVMRLQNIRVAADGAGYSAAFAGGGEATYYVATAGATLTPEIAIAPAKADINGGTADLLIIAHPNFINGDLDRLVQARQAQGYRVKVVDVTQIYSQYSGGVFDPNAIKAYISHAITGMGAQYFLLVGADTNDYFNYGKLGSLSFIPSLYAPTIGGVNFAPVDPLYTDVNNNGVPDRAIGRFPVRTQAELALMVDKALAYDANGAAPTAVLAADRGFQFDSDTFAAELTGWTINKMYAAGTEGSMRASLIAALNAGPRLASFVGHSGPNNWTAAPLLLAGDAAALTNATPMAVTQWGCWNTYYVDPRYDTMGHKFLLSGASGAAVVTGSTTLTNSDSERALGELFMAQLAQPGTTIGGAMQRAKWELGLTNPDMVDVLLGWTILGDPTTVVQR